MTASERRVNTGRGRISRSLPLPDGKWPHGPRGGCEPFSSVPPLLLQGILYRAFVSLVSQGVAVICATDAGRNEGPCGNEDGHTRRSLEGAGAGRRSGEREERRRQ